MEGDISAAPSRGYLRPGAAQKTIARGARWPPAAEARRASARSQGAEEAEQLARALRAVAESIASDLCCAQTQTHVKCREVSQGGATRTPPVKCDPRSAGDGPPRRSCLAVLQRKLFHRAWSTPTARGQSGHERPSLFRTLQPVARRLPLVQRSPPRAPCVRVVHRQCGAPPALPSRLTRPMAVGSARCGNWSPVRAPCASERRHVAVGFRAVPTEGWLGCLITRWPSSPDCGSPLRRAMRDAQAPRVSARGCT